MTDSNAGQGRHETTDLLWAPLLTQPAGNGSHHARQALCLLDSVTAPMITEGLGLLGIIAIDGALRRISRLIVVLWRPSSMPI